MAQEESQIVVPHQDVLEVDLAAQAAVSLPAFLQRGQSAVLRGLLAADV